MINLMAWMRWRFWRENMSLVVGTISLLFPKTCSYLWGLEWKIGESSMEKPNIPPCGECNHQNICLESKKCMKLPLLKYFKISNNFDLWTSSRIMN